jgi:hypothetical protein
MMNEQLEEASIRSIKLEQMQYFSVSLIYYVIYGFSGIVVEAFASLQS